LTPWFEAGVRTTGVKIDLTVSNLLTVPLALVGLVIPLLVLVVNIIAGKISSSLVRHYLKLQKPDTIIYLALSVLALEITFLSFQRFVIDVPEVVQRAFFLLFVLFSLELILLVGMTVGRTIKSMDPSIIFEITQKVLKELVGASFVEEIRRNIGWTIIDSECNKLGIKRSFFGLGVGHPLRSKKRGLISDIDLAGLRAVKRQLLKWSESNNGINLEIRGTFELLTENDDRIASIEKKPKKERVTLITKRLEDCYKVRSLPKKDELRDALDEFKTLTIEFCHTGDERNLRLAFDTYSEILKEYLRLGIRLSKEQQPGILGDWRPLTLILSDIRDIVESAAQGRNRHLIGGITYALRQLMREAMEQRDEYLFSRLAKLFPAVYYFSHNAKSSVGIHRSYFELLQVFDYDLFRYFDDKKDISREEAKFKVGLAFIVYETLHEILRSVVDRNDVATFRELSKTLKPEEFLAHYFMPYRINIWAIRDELEQKQKGTPEWQQLKEKVEALELLIEIPNDYEIFYKDSIFSGLGYLLDHYENRRKTQNQIELFASFMFSQIESVNTSVDFLERSNVGVVKGDRIWEYHEETRQVVSSNPMFLPLLIFCLHGLSVQIVSEQTIDIPASGVLSVTHDQVEKIASDILENSDRWKWLTGSISREVLERFLEGVKKSIENYNEKVAQSIRAAPLSERKIAEFREDVLKAYEENARLKPLLQGKQIIREATALEKSAGVPARLGIYARASKQAFIEQDRVEYHRWGESYGVAIARGEDFHIVNSIYSNSNVPFLPVKSNAKLPDLLDHAIGHLKPKHTASIILVPFRANVRFSLDGSPKFMPSWRSAGLPGSPGTFDGVPIFEYFPKNRDVVLVGTILSSIEIIEFSRLTIDVRLLNELEKKSILEKQRDLYPEKLKEEVIVDISESFRTIVKEPLAFVKFELPSEASNNGGG
jgi:hypothetical protein